MWCDRDSPGGPWIVFLRRLNGSTDFDRTFQEYSDGFGSATSDYWLGKLILNSDFNHTSPLNSRLCNTLLLIGVGNLSAVYSL